MKEIKGSSTQGIDVKSAGGATNINEQKSNMAKPRDESRRTYEEAIYRELIKRGVLREGKKWGKWGFIAAGLGVLAAIIAGLIINPITTIVIIAIAVFIWIRWSTSSG